jgi:hypothetical protein
VRCEAGRQWYLKQLLLSCDGRMDAVGHTEVGGRGRRRGGAGTQLPTAGGQVVVSTSESRREGDNRSEKAEARTRTRENGVCVLLRRIFTASIHDKDQSLGDAVVASTKS